ncbi:unnamed protein product, partial [Ixodes pacificus]
NPSGYLVSVLGVDCMQLSMSITQMPTEVVGVLIMPLLVYLLAARVGTDPALCCAAWMLGSLLLIIPVSRLQNAIWLRIMKNRDERLKRLSDFLSSVRLVKMYAWEDAFMDAVERLRRKEMVPIFLINLLDGFIDSLYSASSSVVMCERTRCIIHLHESRNTEEKKYYRNSQYFVSEILLSDCSFVWTKRKECLNDPTLKSVSLEIAPGSLVGLAGFVGSGKSSLLAAILGDMHCVEGTITTSGRTSYVPQVACVYNMTVRDNILFGEKFDPVRYGRVLEACELLNDINKFPAGDLTEVGEKGETLSGGQKQRISLARAAYSRSTICLLDDSLSALDPAVAARVFTQVVGNSGLLKNRTRILVSNQGNILKNMDQLLLMDGKTVITHQSITDLIEDERAPETLRLGVSPKRSLSSVHERVDEPTSQNEMSSGKMTQDERTSTSMGSLEVALSLLRLSGIWMPLAVAFFVASGAVLAWQQLWIKQWTDASSPMSTSDPQDPSWVRGLVVLCMCDVLFRTTGGALLAIGCRQLSLTLHQSMLCHVLNSPVSFFDAHPRGRLLNRFTVDVEAIDTRLYLTGKQSVQNTLLMLARLFVIGSQVPLILAVGFVAAILLGLGMRIAVRASNSLRFLESTYVSRLLQHVTETVDSLSTVRSYGVVDRFCRHFYRLTDEGMRVVYGFTACFRMTRTMASLLGFVVVLTTLIMTTAFSSEADDVARASSVGLALSSSVAVPMTLSTICLVMFNVFQQIVSLERCLEYTRLPKEVENERTNDASENANQGSRSRALSANETWPTKGRIEFQEYTTSYRPGDLPDVLKAVTFSVQSYEKVGVVGRTGAGKSSLVLALLRVLKASQGRITIDSVDITQVPLRRLRSAITVIPQDPILVRGSLRDNLDPTGTHTDQELWDALQKSHLDEFVAKHPQQLFLETGDGGANL